MLSFASVQIPCMGFVYLASVISPAFEAYHCRYLGSDNLLM